jgi:6-phosphogluconolactonase
MRFKLLGLFVTFLSMHFTTFSQNANLLIGTYTQKGSNGIYVFSFDTATGKATELSHTDSCTSPSFLTISKDKQFVYAVNETSQGMVSAFSLQNNKLALLQQKATNGADPCYITLSPDEHNLFVANYTGGSITQFHRFADGLISNAQQHIQHSGKSINTLRQEKAHVHGTFFTPNGNYLLTPDLGMDQISIYPYHQNASLPLEATNAKSIISKSGAGPRHIAFSKNGQHLYIIEELTGSISVYNFINGQATLIQTVYTHPKTFKGAPGSADIHISPDGLFLYASNRGEENNIAKFPVLNNGKLDESKLSLYPTLGNKPRNFTISADGNWLLVANQDSDNIVVFKRNKITGNLTNSGNTIKVSMPVCLVLF